MARGDSNQEYIRLHKRYGSPLVRVGPNRYSVSQPSDVKTIYELGGKFTKSEYYKPLLSPKRDEQNIFTIQDNELHKDRRRKISPLYTMSSMVSYEKAVDEMTDVCIRKMYQFAEEYRLIEIPHWMQYYAFDVIGEITFNKSFDMMENEGDTTGMIPGIRGANDFLAFLGIVPNLVPWLIALTSALGKKSNTDLLTSYALDVISKNHESSKQSTIKGNDKYDTFLKKLLDMEAADWGREDQHHGFHGFGGGSRTCIGRNISLLEMTKVVPQIVHKFDLILEHPNKPMDTTCAWCLYDRHLVIQQPPALL
ncbi:hypothetical protein BBP40_007346 [Aspergillus hancockii]|nr:hypothetical protein BBP40_007346 [Aspergillus hancockii]